MATRTLSRTQQDVVDRRVTDLLGRSQAYRSMPADQRSEILRNTKSIVEALAADRSQSGDPYAIPLEERVDASSGPDHTFAAEGVNAGVNAAASLVQKVDFPAFVAQLVNGTFHAIVQSSIQQMEAYAELVRSVATSLNEFRDQNVTVNQGREHLASRYPNLLQINMVSGQPRVGMRPGAEFAELPDFRSELGLDEDVTDLDEQTIEEKLVPAARDDVARSRQKLLATMVMMGINRIVVTDGKINAKVRFTFSASDSMTRTATDYDYRNFGTSTVTYDDRGTTQEGEERTYDEDGALKSLAGGNRYSTGAYTKTQQPLVQLTGQTDTYTEAQLAAAGALTGEVSINFKSETFPLERMVSTDQVVQLQQAQGTVSRAVPAPGAPTTQTP